MLWKVALHEYCCYIGVETHRKKHRGQRQRLIAQYTGPFGDGECVQVNDAVKHIVLVLARHPVAQRTQIVAKVHMTSGLDARQDSSHNPKLLVRAAVLSYKCRTRCLLRSLRALSTYSCI